MTTINNLNSADDTVGAPSKKDFDNYVESITSELNKLGDDEITKEFYGSGDYVYVNINILNSTRIFDDFKKSEQECSLD